MSERGTLEKLQIHAFTAPDYAIGSSIGIFEAYVNPNEVTLSYEIEYDSASGAGTTGSRMTFKKMKPGELALNFFLDGTGANGRLVDVEALIQNFQEVTSYNGAIHRVNYLKITWGTLTVKRCVLKSASIAYKLFKPNGVPIRAVIAATFIDNSDDKTRVALAQDESSDLTHKRVVKAGDNLPMLCDQIYGDPRFYLRVAQANGISSFRNLEPGTVLMFPPVDK
jgi:nucleoid-associated protein YgaU